MKIVAMIPCRLGSQRVHKKNLRLLGGKTLSQWVAGACKESGVFSSIYINSEADIFSKVAASSGVNFYKRPPQYSTNNATNDEFALDFIEHVDCDILVQVNPTSPFITAEDIRKFVHFFIEGNYQTLHTVKDEKIEGLYEGRALNFDPMKPMPPSQLLTPVQLFSSSIMAWETNKFRENMAKLNCAVYGGDGKIGYYSLTGYSNLDIDYEKDFHLAEMIVRSMNTNNSEAEYYEG